MIPSLDKILMSQEQLLCDVTQIELAAYKRVVYIYIYKYIMCLGDKQ